MDLDSDRIARNIADLIASKGYKEAQFARLASISQSSLHRITRGMQLPGIEHAVKIARQLNVSVATIICPHGEEWVESPLHPADEATVLAAYREQRALGLTATLAVAAMAVRSLQRVAAEDGPATD